MKNIKKGFTLIELMVVVAIIGILAATLAPKLREQLAKSQDAKAVALLGSVRTQVSADVIDDSLSATPGNYKVNATELLKKIDISGIESFVNVKSGMIAIGGSRKEINGQPDTKIDYNGEVELTLGATSKAAITTGIVQKASDVKLSIAYPNRNIKGNYIVGANSTGNKYSTAKKEWVKY